MISPPNMIWIDLETTGLHPETCQILEIATIVTNGNLEILEEGPNLVIHQPDEVLDAMGPWCTKQHGESGLTAQVRSSTITVAEAERRTLEFLEQHCVFGISPFCGNSVDFDRQFLRRHMPRLAAFAHYRVIDVSTVNELRWRWNTAIRSPKKRDLHRAKSDILESIEELRFYYRHFFVCA